MDLLTSKGTASSIKKKKKITIVPTINLKLNQKHNKRTCHCRPVVREKKTIPQDKGWTIARKTASNTCCRKQYWCETKFKSAAIFINYIMNSFVLFIFVSGSNCSKQFF